jgi:undecaprenyl-diphosphatase
VRFKDAPLLAGLALAALFLVLFGWLSEEVMENETVRFDSEIRTLVHEPSGPALTHAMEFVSNAGSPASITVLTLTAGALFWCFGKRRDTKYLAIAVIGAMILNSLLKLSFHRPRPVPFFGLAPPDSYSFPSGHALISFCFFAILGFLLKSHIRSFSFRLAILALAVFSVLTIGYSRIYLGVHYPSDVLAGFTAGAVWIAAVVTALKRRTPG